MTDLYIVRHCEALGNSTRVFQGTSDCDITECGQRQLELLAERFKNIPLDAVYSSPLKRARRTAEAINRYHGLPIQINDKLIEIDGGEIEGISWVDFPTTRPQLEYYWNMEPHKFHPKGGEAMESVYRRSWEAVREIVSQNEGKTVALASHGCTIRNMLCHAQGKPIEELNTVDWADNTGVFLLRFDGGELPEILMFNDISHLTEDCLPKRNRIGRIFCKKPADMAEESGENKPTE